MHKRCVFGMSHVVLDDRAGDLYTGPGHAPGNAARHASEEGELIEGAVDEVENFIL